MNDFRYIAWTDLETTGLSFASDNIIEVGIVLTDLDLNLLGERSWLVNPGTLDLLAMHPIARNLHADNGLIADLLDAQEEANRPGGDPFLSVANVDALVVAWLHRWVGRVGLLKPGDLALAGSGVSHFDTRFLERDMPRFSSLLHRSTLDVGVMRRFIENVVGRPRLVPKATRDLTHRALDDAHQHLREAARYRDLLKKV